MRDTVLTVLIIIALFAAVVAGMMLEARVAAIEETLGL